MPPTEINLKSASYFIAQSVRNCWHCKRDSAVFGIVLPPGHEELAHDDDDDDEMAPAYWSVNGLAAILFNVTQLPDKVQKHLRSLTGRYRSDFSKVRQHSYWMNHCEHCGMKQGDFETFEEYDSPFRPVDPHRAARIVLRPVAERIEISAASIAYEPDIYKKMRTVF